MYEDFLHFIWQFQYFDTSQLHTSQQDTLSILDKGFPNSNAGADFHQARILINGVEWVGNVEIHLKSSHWNQHKHHLNPQYNAVILHVVWEDDQPVQREDRSYIPTLTLKDRVNSEWLYKYQAILAHQSPIPCASQLREVRPLTKMMMLDQTLVRRLEEKTFLFKALLIKNQGDWEESTYQLLSKNFGFKINSEAFLSLSQAVPLKVLQKHRDQVSQVEALLFGQAGFLDERKDDPYFKNLQQEYLFLSEKYRIYNRKLDAAAWKFLRLRPANFPEIRIAQLAALICKDQGFFSIFLENNYEELRKIFKVTQNPYWQEHYRFAKKSSKKISGLGKTSIDNIIINTVVPVLATYSLEKGHQEAMDKALQLLEKLPAENNYVLRIWAELGQPVKTAYDSQALIELYNHYCKARKCLHCSIGIELIQK